MRLRPIELRAIVIPDGRVPDEATVSTLMESMKAVGLLNPITVQRHQDHMRIFLVSGRNRLEAARRLKWKEIDTVEIAPLDHPDGGADLAAMAEIAENLHRRELPALERAALVARWAEMARGRPGVSAQVAQKIGRGRPAGGASAVARDIGVSRDEIRRSTKIASLFPEAQAAARDVGLDDNRSALLEAAAKKTPEEQVAALRRRAGGDHQADVGALRRAWEAADADERRSFLIWIGIPEGAAEAATRVA